MGKGHRRCEVCGIKEAWHTGNTLLFSKFPLDPDRCREWLKAVGNEELVHLPIEKLHEQRNLCAKHFGKKDFNKKGNRLKRHAIPSLNLMALPLTDGQLAEFPQHVYGHSESKESLNDEQRRKPLQMREQRKQFDSRRTGISVTPEVADFIEITTCPGADDINCAEEVQVCRVCLAMDVKMYNLKDTELKTMFQNITGITLNETDHAILGQVCWECAARLKAAASFRSKALLSDSLLQELINTGEQIRKREITTIKENEGSLTKTLTAIEVFHIVDIENQNITQPLESAEDSNQSLLSEHDDTENNIIIEIQQEKPAMDVEEDEINVPIQCEIGNYLCFNNGEEKNQDSTFSSQDTINSTYSKPLLDTGVPLLETRIKIQKNNPKDSTSARENTITAARGSPLLDMGLSSLSQENCEEQINKNVNKKNTISEINSKILPEQTTEPNKRRKEAVSYGRTYLKAVTKVGNKKKK